MHGSNCQGILHRQIRGDSEDQYLAAMETKPEAQRTESARRDCLMGGGRSVLPEDWRQTTHGGRVGNTLAGPAQRLGSATATT